MVSDELKARCRELRKNPTEAESIIWTELRNKRLGGYKFRRQHPYAGFILDFYCAEARLGIELDGGVHKIESNAEYDKDRDEILTDYGVYILRFWNSEVTKDLEGVTKQILETLKQRAGNMGLE